MILTLCDLVLRPSALGGYRWRSERYFEELFIFDRNNMMVILEKSFRLFHVLVLL